MSLLVVTHSGPFHADDVTAVALLRTFRDPQLDVVRSRDPADWARGDIVVDVGAVYDPATGRFDHHQESYTGPLSAAGMVLAWLAESAIIDADMARHLRETLVDYLDEVDNGRTAPKKEVPCFPQLVSALNQTARTSEEFDACFSNAVDVATQYLAGLVAERERVLEARDAVVAEMNAAAAEGREVLFFDSYLRWKAPYFDHQGESHPTVYALHPGTDGTWRIVAVPPRLGDFGQKRPLPEAWAGKSDAELEAVTGIPGSVFCHKNRFIAVFQTRSGAIDALRSVGTRV